MTNSDKSNKGVLTNPEPLNDTVEGDITQEEKDLRLKQNDTRIYSNNDVSSTTGAPASSDLSDTTLEDLYKMKAHGRKGHRDPTRIEFDLMRGRGIRKNKLSYQLDKKRISKEPAVCTCMQNKEVPIVKQSSWSKLQKNIFTAKTNIDSKVENVVNSEKINPIFVEGKEKGDEKIKKTKDDESNCPNMDIYYFDHGNSVSYFHFLGSRSGLIKRFFRHTSEQLIVLQTLLLKSLLNKQLIMQLSFGLKYLELFMLGLHFLWLLFCKL